MEILIRQAQLDDLSEIVQIEREIEPDSPAELGVLQSRLTMFQNGFLTAWLDGRLLGYAQSCIWAEKIPRFSPEKDFFKDKHDVTAGTLYIIFIGVRPQYQRQGVGSRLIQSLRDIASEHGMKRVHAVTWEHLQKLYIEQGFKPVMRMPGFLPKGEFNLLEYRVKNKPGN